MSIAQAKENIITLLENIIKRSEYIEKQKGSKNLLEIDLAMEDVRMLYREMDRLRKYTEAESVNAPLEIRERNLSGRKSENHIPETEKQVTPGPVESPVQPAPEEAQKKDPTPLKHPDPVSPSGVEEPPVAPAAAEPQAPLKSETKEESPAASTSDEEVNPHEETSPFENQKETPTGVEETVVPRAKSEQSPPETRRQEPRKEISGKSKPIVELLDTKKTVVGESFTNHKSSVHERLAQIKDDKSIGTRMQYKPVPNMKDAIGINDKFVFINELFNGDLNAYSEAVNQLNSCPSIHEAFELLNKLTIEFQWDGQRSAETIEKFANLVQRRYM